MSDVVEMARFGSSSIGDVVDGLGLGDGDSCGRCADHKGEIISLVSIELYKPPTARPSPGRAVAQGVMASRDRAAA
ncbi:MAG: hypothetical protein J4F43_11560 [Dehalococcoidia bacterium]|nr:hypothetical protein [Dehalococcoidia bacterium]